MVHSEESSIQRFAVGEILDGEREERSSGASAPAGAIHLRITTGLPSGNPIERVFEGWAERIQHETGGRVQFTFCDTSAQGFMGSETWTDWRRQLGSVFDISHGITMMAGSPFIIGKELPLFTYGTDIFGAGQVFNELISQFPEVANEYSDLRLLCGFANPEHWLYTKNRPVLTLGDFKNLRYLVFGIQSEVLGRLGGVPVETSIRPMTRVGQSLEDGVVDGLVDICSILTDADLGTIRYATNMHMPMPPGDFLAMSLDKWNTLPADIQTVFDTSGLALQAELEQTILRVEQDALLRAKAKGVECIELDSAELSSFYSILEDMASKRAAALDAQGLPGTRVLQSVRRLIDVAGRSAPIPVSDRSMNLKVASGLHSTHPWEIALHRWAERIQTETGGRVTFSFVDTSSQWGGVAPSPDVVGVGLGDVFASAQEEKFKYSDIAGSNVALSMLPIGSVLPAFIYGTDLIGARVVFNRLRETCPEITREYTDRGVKRLFGHGEADFHVQTMNKPIRRLADFEGTRICVLLGELSEVFARLGAAELPVDLGRGYYEGVANRSIDGTLGWAESLMTLEGLGIVRYSTNLHVPLPPQDFYQMNPAIWDSLPSDVQRVIENNNAHIESEIDRVSLQIEREAIELAKKNGVEFIELPPEDLKAFSGLLEERALKKAAEIDAKGHPGTRIFHDARRIIEEHAG